MTDIEVIAWDLNPSGYYLVTDPSLAIHLITFRLQVFVETHVMLYTCMRVCVFIYLFIYIHTQTIKTDLTTGELRFNELIMV